MAAELLEAFHEDGNTDDNRAQVQGDAVGPGARAAAQGKLV